MRQFDYNIIRRLREKSRLEDLTGPFDWKIRLEDDISRVDYDV